MKLLSAELNGFARAMVLSDDAKQFVPFGELLANFCRNIGSNCSKLPYLGTICVLAYGVEHAVGVFIKRNVWWYFCTALVNWACCCSFFNLNLQLPVVTIRHVLQQRGRCSLIDFVVRVVQRG